MKTPLGLVDEKRKKPNGRLLTMTARRKRLRTDLSSNSAAVAMSTAMTPQLKILIVSTEADAESETRRLITE
jgi:hypothetical protein